MHPAPRPKPPARWYLRMQAVMWRFLMAIGMWLHRFAPPRPMRHSFVKRIPTTISPTKGSVNLYFYTPKNYKVQRRLGKPATRFPVVLVFHGGGFTIGHATDDAKWATTVVAECNAVVVAVDYRLAPEFPFPTAVEDGVDAVLYLARNAEALHIDPNRIAMSGFSSGGNLALTVPLRLHEELSPNAGTEDAADARASIVSPAAAEPSLAPVAEGEQLKLDTGAPSRPATTGPSNTDSTPTSPVHPTKARVRTFERELPATSNDGPDDSSDDDDDAATVASEIARVVKPVAVVSWYPPADYTLTRAQRRETCARTDMELSPMFTALFDASYMPSSSGSTSAAAGADANLQRSAAALATDHGDLDRANPFLSPGRAPDALLRAGLPDEVAIYTCEWDMLRKEGTALRERLAALGKHAQLTMVPGVPHAWDKTPNPFTEARGVREHYADACRVFKRAFAAHAPFDEDAMGSRRRSFGIGRLSFGGRGSRDARRESIGTV